MYCMKRTLTEVRTGFEVCGIQLHNECLILPELCFISPDLVILCEKQGEDARYSLRKASDIFGKSSNLFQKTSG